MKSMAERGWRFRNYISSSWAHKTTFPYLPWNWIKITRLLSSQLNVVEMICNFEDWLQNLLCKPLFSLSFIGWLKMSEGPWSHRMEAAWVPEVLFSVEVPRRTTWPGMFILGYINVKMFNWEASRLRQLQDLGYLLKQIQTQFNVNSKINFKLNQSETTD